MLNYLLECIFTKCQAEGNYGQEQTRLIHYKLVSVEFNMIFSRLSIYACILNLSTWISVQRPLLYIYWLPSLMVMQLLFGALDFCVFFVFFPKMFCCDSFGAQ